MPEKVRDISQVLSKVADFIVYDMRGPKADMGSFYAYKASREGTIWKVDCYFTKGFVKRKSAKVEVDDEGNIVRYEESTAEK
jgi:glycine betaine/choline ABC-type transport system substrate-binding protein